MTARKILLIGLDGLRIDDALERGDAPTLAGIIGAGTVLPMTMEVPTISGPGWTSILTGSSHADHGVFDNTFHGHMIDRNADLLSRAYFEDQRRSTFAATSWPPIIDPAGPGPIIAARPDQQAQGRHRIIVRDGEVYGYRWADGEVAATARYAVKFGAPDVSFVYLGEIDEAGHLYGGTSPEYAAAIRRVDALLGGILAEVEARIARPDVDEEWLVAVTTDHGHLDEGGHGGGDPVLRRSFLALARYGADEPVPTAPAVEPWTVVGLLLADLNGRAAR